MRSPERTCKAMVNVALAAAAVCAATAYAGFKVKKDATGLRLVYGKGFMIIVK